VKSRAILVIALLSPASVCRSCDHWTVIITGNAAPQIADLALAVLPAGCHKQHLTAM
jgi:hypothetical protein